MKSQRISENDIDNKKKEGYESERKRATRRTTAKRNHFAREKIHLSTRGRFLQR